MIGEISHNPCFNRILFAIVDLLNGQDKTISHNPCFNRILFAMNMMYHSQVQYQMSQSLF